MNIKTKSKEIERKTANINVRVYPTEKTALEIIAIDNKMDLSEYIRIQLRKLIKKDN